jgi:hypothetical protein
LLVEPTRRQLDVLHVSLGTTFGARRGDAELISALRRLALRVEQLRVDLAPVERLRNRTPPLTDLAEAAAVRVALSRALQGLRPRAIVYSATTSALLQPSDRLGIPSAVWMDAPAASNRPGRRNGAQRALERRYMRSARVLIGKARRTCEVLGDMAPPGVPVVRLPVPLGDRSPSAAPGAGIPRRYAITYAGSPHKKGLDLVAAAWREAEPQLPLLVSGLDCAAGVAFLR